MVTTVIAVLIAVAAALVVAIPVTSKIAVDRRVREDQATIGSAEEKARQLALKPAVFQYFRNSPKSSISVSILMMPAWVAAMTMVILKVEPGG